MPRRLLALTRSFRQSRTLRQSLLVFGSTTAANVLSYVFQFAATHKLGPEHYGALTSLLAVLNVSIVPAAIITTIVAKYAAEFRALDDLAHLKRLTDGIIKYGTIAAVAVFAIGSLFVSGVGAFLHIPDTPAVLLALLLLALNAMLPVLRGVVQGTQDFRAYVISVCIEAAGKAAFGVAAALAGYGAAGMFAGWCIGSVVALVFTAVTLVRRYRHVPEKPLFIDAKRLVATTLNVAIATLVIAILNNADLIIVKHFFDPKTAGLYGIAALAGKTLLFLVAFVPTIVLPRAASAAASGKSPIGVLLQGTALLGVLAGGGLLGYAIAPGRVILALGGPAYLSATYLVLPYAIAMVELAALNALVTYKTGIHRFDFVIPLSLVGVGEIVAMSLAHDTPMHVVQIMMIGNAIGLALCSLRVNAPLASAAATPRLADEASAA